MFGVDIGGESHTAMAVQWTDVDGNVLSQHLPHREVPAPFIVSRQMAAQLERLRTEALEADQRRIAAAPTPTPSGTAAVPVCDDNRCSRFNTRHPGRPHDALRARGIRGKR